jgi:hypothetical protein
LSGAARQDEQMGQRSRGNLEPPEELNWPTRKLLVAPWMYITTSVLTVVPFLIPDLVTIPLPIRIAIVIVLLVVLPFINMLLLWFLQSCKVIYQRVIYYPTLSLQMRQTQIDVLALREKNKLLTSLSVESLEIFSIVRVSYYQDRFRIFVSRREDISLKEGDKLLVVDIEDRTPIGLFEVSHIRPYDYIAKLIDQPDPIWLGYIVQQGTPEMSPPPNSVAILVPQGGTP